MIRKYTQILLHNKGPLSRVKDFARALSQLREESSSYSNPSISCLIYGVRTQIVNRGTGLQVNRLGVLRPWKGIRD